MVSFSKRRGRAAAVGGATAGVLVMASALSPIAAAAPVTEVHDFADGVQGWFSYPGTSAATSAESGELCTVVQDHTGNPWDVAVQHDAVAYEDGTTYTVSFDAHASKAVSIPMQGGGAYPDVFGHAVTLDGSATPQHVEFDFTPDGWSAPAGNVSFQLGNQGTGYTFCIDDFSIAPAFPELIPNGDFASPTLDPWFAAGALGTPDLSSGSLVLPVTGGGQYDGVGFNGVPITAGKAYTLTFHASASSEKTIRVVVGQSDAPYGTVLDSTAALTPEGDTYTYTFTASATYPAVSAAGDPAGQLAFQIGGRGDGWTFTLDDVSLKESATPPPLYEPETGPRVRVNQVGYLPEGPKRATLVTAATEPVAWELRDGAEVVAQGVSRPEGVDPTAGINVHVIDFSGVTETGTYTLVADGETSYEFVVDADIYAQLRYDALDYFYPVRSGIAIDGSIIGDAEYTRPAGHVENPASTLVAESPNKGDVDVECLTDAAESGTYSYGDWTCATTDGATYALDVTGGWYDAGDHGKYVVNGGIAVAQLMSTYERTLHAATGDPGDLGDGTLDIPAAEQTNGVPDVLDEARWELEWMMSMQVPANAVQYAGMVHHKIHDMGWTGLPLLPDQDPQARYLHRPSTAATLNFAAVAAQGARLWEQYDAEFAADLLAAGLVAWDAALATPALYAPGDMGGNGGGPYDDSEVGDEFYWAAAELFLTTGEAEFEEHVLGSEYHTADIWTESGITWGATAGLGRIALATVPSDLPGVRAIRASVVAGAERYLAWQAEQPFGTTYPGLDGVYEWGSNSMVLNNQVVLATAFDITGEQRFADGVLEAMDYLLGRNALNTSYITGYGEVYSENQHSRWFANSLDPALPNPPVGAVSGGPNSTVSTWDPTISGLYNGDHMCAPQLCYVDHIQSWATNEITVNWNSVMSQVASFVADLGDGAPEVPGSGVVTVEPVRVLDVANAATGAVQCWPVAGEGPVPADATGVVLNVTTVRPNANGYVVVYPDTSGDGTTPVPSTSTVNFEPGQDVANTTFVALSANGDLCYAVQGATSVGLKVDLSGWLTGDSGVVLQDPERLLDTRPGGVGEVDGAIPARGTETIQVAGELGVPADARSVIANVTVTGFTQVGNLRVFPGGEDVPNASVVNYAPGIDKANSTVVALGEDGTISLHNDSNAAAHVIVDVLGYTLPGTGHVGIVPTRVLDTRAATQIGELSGALTPRTVYSIAMPEDVVPVGATAVVLNVTAVLSHQWWPPSLGNLRVYPDSAGTGATPPPNASTINYIPSRDIPNLVVVDLPVNGRVNVWSDQFAGSVHLAVDVVGFITPVAAAPAV